MERSELECLFNLLCRERSIEYQCLYMNSRFEFEWWKPIDGNYVPCCTSAWSTSFYKPAFRQYCHWKIQVYPKTRSSDGILLAVLSNQTFAVECGLPTQIESIEEFKIALDMMSIDYSSIATQQQHRRTI